MISRSISALFFLALSATVIADPTEIRYLSGTDKDHTVDWQFKVSGGRNSGHWTTIPVPSNWEMQGFGSYRYWSDWEGTPAPDREGLYRHTFSVPANWRGKNIEIVFGGAMTDTEVRINGAPAGPVHRGGFYEFRYDIGEHLNYGEDNLLEVTVARFSADESINLAERRADFWMFSGIYRPVWLEARPAQHIRRAALDAGHTGDFHSQVFLGGIDNADSIRARITTLDGKRIGRPFSVKISPGQKQVSMETQVEDILPWSAEKPHRYRAVFELRDRNKTLHQVEEIFGFRTVEVRPRDGLYINGRKVRLKGANRHAFWPDSGRTTSPEISRRDVELIKEMNMNAVRVGHYPPDRHFLQMTDELGLYVIDELTGWQDAYSTEAGRPLVKELILRDHNHPSVIIWANGNEGGWNTELDGDFSHWDIQRRPVIHPWELFGGINTAHYERYNCCTGSLFGGGEVFMPTEFLHGLYDGGAAAGLDDWWKRMLQNPLSAGGFIWALVDEGVVRDDRHGAIDTAGNSAPDGILGPYREKEGSFFAIREIWSPVYFPQSEQSHLPTSFDGVLEVANRYDFTNLREADFRWALIDFPGPAQTAANHKADHKVAVRGRADAPDVAPGRSGALQLELPEDWRSRDALALTARDHTGREIYTWTWMITPPATMARRLMKKSEGAVTAEETQTQIRLGTSELQLSIDKGTGRLAGVSRGGKKLSLSNGPRLVSGDGKLSNIGLRQEAGTQIVSAQYQGKGEMRRVEWRLHPSGWLQLTYAYQMPGQMETDYLGVTFDYPEEKVTGVRWLGRGPSRVWKNRLKGVTFDIWHKNYNDTVTGQSWEYPEFKGFHRDLYWAQLETRELPITLVATAENTFLRLFTPKEAKDPRQTSVGFPAGDISLLTGIAPIGTKFHPPEAHGPQGASNRVRRLGQWYQQEVFLYFGALPD
ncbi:glycoside hydrolase family 2 TIM barrel-domain containing protein [Microbulbifer sp.]|uniref:glycoside hydrolase family 2 TIM barrel-domain containing protein n=1 Tax=Microbulbifer sp. TaxID=1908541 RepID=UPI003F415DD1